MNKMDDNYTPSTQDSTLPVFGWRRLLVFLVSPVLLVSGAWLMKRGGLADSTVEAFFENVFWMYCVYLTGDSVVKTVRALSKK